MLGAAVQEDTGADRRPDGNGLDGAGVARVAALLLLVLLLVKVYGVARFSAATATRLATAAPLSVVLGTLALYEYAFMALLAGAGLLLFIAGLLGRGNLRLWAPLSLALAVFAVLITPLLYLIWAGGALVVILALWLALHRWVSLTRVALSVTAPLLAGFVLVTLTHPWLPAEVVTLRTPVIVNPRTKELASRPVVYLVSEQNGWVTMLVDSDRYLAVVPATDIQSQRICQANSQPGEGQTLYQRIIRQSYYSPELACWQLTDQPEEQG
jgi:hypothetical protein